MLALLVLSVAWNCMVYSGAKFIASTWHHTDITSSFDMMIPFIPWTAIIYVSWYVFWVGNYALCAVQEENERTRFFCADIIVKAICLIIFLVFPTTNVRPEVGDSGFFENVMRLIYYIDTPDNLFPSIHCAGSWMCWIGVRKRKDIPIAYRIFSLLLAVAICISTLTTKQHVIIDVISGIVLAEGCYMIAGIQCIHTLFSKIFDAFLRMLRIRRSTK